MASKKRNHTALQEDLLRIRFTPRWVISLARAKGGSQAFFIAAKRLEKSDLARQQNRLLLPKDFVDAYLLPALSESERTSANLIGESGGGAKKKKKTYPKKKTQQPPSAADGAAEPKQERMAKVVGRQHGGLAVTAFARNGLRFRLSLTRWDSNQETVVKGDEVKLLTTFSSFAVGDEIEVWGFRLVDGGGLCFAIGRRA